MSAKVLIFDIETAPMLGWVWSLWDNNVALNQLQKDWYVLSFSAKWLGDPASKIMYADQRYSKTIENDLAILKRIWKLLDEADVVITQNGKKFDVKKLNARFIIHGLQPPSSYRHIDTLVIAKRHFAFSSNSLEYMTNLLCTKHKKTKSAKYNGFTLWSECMKGNKDAFEEMKKYNCMDVMSLEELYYKLIPWDNTLDFSVYHEEPAMFCSCGSTSFKKNGYAYTSTGKFQRLACTECGSEKRSKVNLLTKEKRDSLPKGGK